MLTTSAQTKGVQSQGDARQVRNNELHCISFMSEYITPSELDRLTPQACEALSSIVCDRDGVLSVEAVFYT